MKTLSALRASSLTFSSTEYDIFSFTTNYHILKTTPSATSVGLMIKEYQGRLKWKTNERKIFNGI